MSSIPNPAAERYRGMLAIQVSAPERLAFLRKVYSLFGAAIVAFAGVTWWATNNETALRLVAPVLSHGFIGVVLLMGLLFMLLRVASSSFPLNMIALFAFAAAEGLLTGPLVTVILREQPDHGAMVVTQAAVLTAVVFGGLTLYTLTSRRDFSFLGAALWTGFAILMGFALLGWLFGFDAGTWGASLGWVLLMSGFVIYDTSNIMRRYPVTAAVPAAIALFLDVIILFRELLFLLSRRR